MKYGFIIDNRKCIGCHSCTTACKSEYDVAIGVNRTYVKQVEKGESYKKNEILLTEDQLQGIEVDPVTDVIRKKGKDIGVMINGEAMLGFPTPSRKNEFYSQTMVDWKWSEYQTLR